jgi:lysozyme
MEFSAAGFKLLKQSEGFRSHVYKDVEGFPTIGYGHRLLHPDSFADGVNTDGAAQILACDVDDAESAVLRLVKVPLTQGQFDALVDFVFNLGWARLSASTLLKELNAGHYEAAAQELLRWDRAGTEENAGLKARREAELVLWNTTETKSGTAGGKTNQ